MKVLAAVFSVIAAVCLLFKESVYELLDLWLDTNKTTFTHGLLLAVISCWLLWRRRELLVSSEHTPSVTAALLFAAGAGVWLLANRSGIQFIYVCIFPALIWLSICAVMGWRTGIIALFPIAFLYFALPVWDLLVPLLQKATVVAVEFMVHATGIPAYVEGNVVHIAAGSFEVEGGCSGTHFFMVGLSLGALYGELQFDPWRVRLRLFIHALLLSVFSNWVRVYCIVLAGYLTDMQHYLVRVEHYRFGWLVFAVMMVVFLFVARRIPVGEPPPLAQVAAAPRMRPAAMKLLLVLLVLVSVPLWNLFRPVKSTAVPDAIDLVPKLANWAGPEPQVSETWQPVSNGADRAVLVRYERGGDAAVQLYVAAYGHQEQGKELVAYGNSLVSERGADVVSDRSAGPYREIEIRDRAGRAWVIRYAYRIGQAQTTDPLREQLMYGFAAVRGPVLSQIVAFRAECSSECDQARALLGQFQAALAQVDP